MDFDAIFEAYYNLYRVEAETPASTDDEYTVAMRLANEAVSRWENYDDTKWKQLYDTNLNDGSGSQAIVTGTTLYDGPDNFQEAGGEVKVKDSSGNTQQHYRIIDPQEVQFQGDQSTYAYFTGNPGEGYELHINPAPPSSLNGMSIDYVYYKQATTFTTGSDTTEMSNPYFIVHRMLANRFRASRNPYYTSAKTDAEDALRIMKMENDSGSWGNPWLLPDRSGSIFGG